MDVLGVTHCTACGGALEPVDATDDRPIQTVEQACAVCDERVTVGLCWYPGNQYDIVASVPTDSALFCDECGASASTVVTTIDTVPTAYCDTCLPAHHARTRAVAVD